VFRVNGDAIVPRFALGEDSGQLQNLKTCSGQGLLGWVVLTQRAISNANPAVDTGADTRLRSAMVVPIGDGNELTGVVALYSTRPDAFTDKDLRELQDLQEHIAARLRNDAANDSAQVDHFSPQPNKQMAGVVSQAVCGLP
jgi:GAF domain-containing protein